MKSPGLAVVLVVAALGAAVAMPLLAGSDTASNQRRVLVISEARGYKHASIPDQVRFLQQLGRRSRRFDVVHLSKASDLTKEQLAGLEGRRVRQHHRRAADRRRDPPGAGRLRQGRRRPGRPALRVQHLRPLAALPAPAGGGLQEPPAGPGRDGWWSPTVATPRPAASRGPSGSATSSTSSSAHRAAAPTSCCAPTRRSISGETRRDLPVAWCRREGRGRVFYSGLGHFGSAWRSDRRLRRLVDGGLALDAGRVERPVRPLLESSHPPPWCSG